MHEFTQAGSGADYPAVSSRSTLLTHRTCTSENQQCPT